MAKPQERKQFYFGKKNQKTERTALRSCPGLTRASTRFRPKADGSRRVKHQAFRRCRRVDTRVKPGHGFAGFLLLFFKKEVLPKI
jgi:hypothetical protein